MLYNRCTDIYKFGNNTHKTQAEFRSHFSREKKCVLWAGKYDNECVAIGSLFISRFCFSTWRKVSDESNGYFMEYMFDS